MANETGVPSRKIPQQEGLDAVVFVQAAGGLNQAKQTQ